MKKLLLLASVLFSINVVSQTVVSDPTFNIGTGTDDSVMKIKVLESGKIMVGGFFTSYNGVTVPSLIRLNGDGTLDNSFNSAFAGQVQDMIVEDNGKIVAVGVSSQVTRLNPDGTIDTTFNPPAIMGDAAPYNIIKAGTKYVIMGKFNVFSDNGSVYRNLLRLHEDGAIDTTLQPTNFTNFTTSFYTYGEALLLQDGKLLVYGYFNTYNGSTVNSIMRLNVNGTIDTSFDTGIGSSGMIMDAKQQPDGKLIVSGYFTHWNNEPKHHYVRLNPDGTLDPNFNYEVPEGYTEDGLAAWDMELLPNGQILAAGDAMESPTVDFTIPRKVIRLHPNGQTDTTFVTDFQTSGWVRDIEIQGDGKIIAGGHFTAYGDTPQSNLTRLLPAALNLELYYIDKFAVYPNPVSNYLTIAGFSGSDGKATIIDPTGKILSVINISQTERKLDMSAYSAGTYIIQIQSGNELKVVKVLKN